MNHGMTRIRGCAEVENKSSMQEMVGKKQKRKKMSALEQRDSFETAVLQN